MRNASEGLLYDVLTASTQFPIIKAEYLDDSNEWQEFEDIVTISIKEEGTKNDYSVFNLIPKAADLNMTLQNFSEKYTPGAGGEFDGVIKRDRKVRVSMGYKVLEAVPVELAVPLTQINTLYHAAKSGSKIFADPVAGITPSLENFTVNAGVLTFNDTPPGDYGYWINEDGDRVMDQDAVRIEYDNRPRFFAYALTDPVDTFKEKSQDVKKIIFDSDTDQIYVFYRVDNDETDILTRDFIYAGQSASGSNEIDITPTTDQFIQVVFCWANNSFSGSSEYIENVKIGYDDFSEFFEQGIFLMDTPNTSSASGNYTVSFTARDDLRKAMENSISLPAYSSADAIQPLRDAAERLNIPYTTTSLPTLSHTITISDDDTWTDQDGDKVLNEIMVYINAVIAGNKFLVMRDGLLTLEDRLFSLTNADYGLSTIDQLFTVNRQGVEKNLIGRASVQADRPSTASEIDLDSSNYTSTGSHVITYPAGSHTGKFIQVSVVVDYKNSDPDTAVEITANSLTSITYEIKGSGTIDVDVTVRGNEIKAPAVYAGESFSVVNYINRTGFTDKITNRLLQSDSEAKTVADQKVFLFGDQFFRVSVTGRALPMLETGDRVVVIDKKTALNNILFIESIEKTFEANGAVFNTTLTLRDGGSDLDNWNYDRNNVINGGQIRGADDLLYDSNWFWDQDLYLEDSDETNYNYLRPLVGS